MIGKILICSDGSEQAQHAASLAATIARQYDAEILLLNVFDSMYAIAPDIGLWAGFDGNLFENYVRQMQAEIKQGTLPLFAQAGVRAKVRFEIGHPVDCIVTVAEEEKTDLIVLGTRGMSTWKSALIGSVSDGVTRHAPCPILIVRGEGEPDTPMGFRKILLATDGSECALKAAQEAAEFAGRFQADLIAVHVAAPREKYAYLLNAQMDPECYYEAVCKPVEQRTQQALQPAGIPSTFRHESGSPAEVIVHVAAKENADLIVLGSRGLGTFKALLLGSVSDRVVHHACCPVLIVR